jgi:hypothetical protein
VAKSIQLQRVELPKRQMSEKFNALTVAVARDPITQKVVGEYLVPLSGGPEIFKPYDGWV